MTVDYILGWAKRASQERFVTALEQISSAQKDPFPGDELPDDLAWLREVDVAQIASEVFMPEQ